MPLDLDPFAAAAVAHVEARADGPSLDPALRVTVNFHPDREVGGLSVVAALARDRVYRSQFETGTSGGGLTAYPGGDRAAWEQQIFGGAYDSAPAALRPRYGALDHRRRSVGGAVRFGSAHLRLTGPVLGRSTFCFPDSAHGPSRFGTARHAGQLLELVEKTRLAPLDEYVEAHVHGGLNVDEDVESIVLDPCFRGTRVEDDAALLGVPLTWHEGRVLPTGRLVDLEHFRGHEVVALARAWARAGRLDARLIGEAVRAQPVEPRLARHVWHLVAAFGDPAG